MSGTTHDLPLPTRRRSSRHTRLTRRDFLAGAGALTAGLALDAWQIARHDIDIVDRTISIRRLPPAFRGFRVLQISDIHLVEFTEPLFLQLVVHRINQLAPDLVLLTGDFVSDGPFARSVALNAAVRCAQVLQGIACPLRFACLGNHDNGIGGTFVAHTLEAHGIPTLVNRYVPIERGGQHLWLGGVDDPGTGNPLLALAVPNGPDAPVLLMSHAPDYTDRILQHPRAGAIDLVLSGHSHGGQVRLPFMRPLVLPPMGEKYVEGLFRFGDLQLYVNRGIGATGLPLRLNCPPEITVLTLHPA